MMVFTIRFGYLDPWERFPDKWGLVYKEGLGFFVQPSVKVLSGTTQLAGSPVSAWTISGSGVHVQKP